MNYMYWTIHGIKFIYFC